MPRRTPNLELQLQAVVQAVAKHQPPGAFLEDVENGITIEISRRALQRRLASLVEQKRLTTTGERRGTRYYAPVSGNDEEPAFPSEREGELEVSTQAKSLRVNVRAPRHLRTPVGYNRDFLDNYQPNQTFYLSDVTRVRLAEVGYRHSGQGEQPAGTYAREILGRLLIDLSWNSSRLEGNTYSLLETERLLQLGESASDKDIKEAQMILNHKAAIEMLVEDAEEIGFNRYTILNLHGLLSDNLLSDPGASGRLRSIPVSIGGTVFHPLAVPQLIDECFNSLLAKAAAITDPFEQAFFAMVHLPYLQPFEDVNKRVSRLAANIPLIRFNLCPISFVDVPERDYIDGILGVYELNRVELLHDVFVWAYERSCKRYAAVRQSLGEPDPFRLRYRTRLIEIISHVIRGAMDKKQADAFIRQAVEAVPHSDRARLLEVAETDLQHLHEGNFARYRVRPSEFEAWQNNWH